MLYVNFPNMLIRKLYSEDVSTKGNNKQMQFEEEVSTFKSLFLKHALRTYAFVSVIGVQ